MLLNAIRPDPNVDARRRGQRRPREALPLKAIKAELEAQYGTLTSRVSPPILAGCLKIYDFVVVALSGVIAFYAYQVEFLGDIGREYDRYSLVALLGAISALVLFHVTGAYGVRRLREIGWQVRDATFVWSMLTAGGLIAAFVTKTSQSYSRGWVISWYLLALGLLLIGRIGLGTQIKSWFRQGKLARNVVVVGAGALGVDIIVKLHRMVRENIRILGLFDDRADRVPAIVEGHKVYGTTDDLLLFARELPVDEIIVALPLNAEERLNAIVAKLKMLPVDLRLSMAPIAEGMAIRGITQIGTIPALDVAEKPLKHWSYIAKFVEDRVLSGLALLCFSIPMALIALAIKLDSRGPVLFIQERYGFNNRVIRVFKFRTMYVDEGDITGTFQTVRNDPRVTRIGRWLRKSSLDELPQLINVLKGEMSLVGPRAHALTMKAAGELYYEAVEEYFSRHRVKPGMTGWAQIHGLRGGTETIEKARRRVEYDLWYIENWSLWLDLKILLATTQVFFKSENAY